jgi:hypothetical protein
MQCCAGWISQKGRERNSLSHHEKIRYVNIGKRAHLRIFARPITNLPGRGIVVDDQFPGREDDRVVKVADNKPGSFVPGTGASRPRIVPASPDT